MRNHSVLSPNWFRSRLVLSTVSIIAHGVLKAMAAISEVNERGGEERRKERKNAKRKEIRVR